MITYDDFEKVEIKAGKILSAEKVEKADKLLRLMVDFGEVEAVAAPVPATPEASVAQAEPVAPVAPATSTAPKPKPRQIVSGIAMYFPDPQVLVGKTCMFVTNLEPRTIRGLESNGMLFAVSTPEGAFSLLEPGQGIPPGTRAK